VRKHVQAGSALYTDALLSYEGLEGDYAHMVVDHAVQYVDGKVHTNGLENFWSLFSAASTAPMSASNRSIYSATWTNRSSAITTALHRTIQ